MNARNRLPFPIPHLPQGATLPFVGLGARLFWPVVALILLAIASTATIWFLAYGITPGVPNSARLRGLQQPAEIGWLADGGVRVSANDERDAAVALGYAHATSYLWQIALWRQTARGELTLWFGPDLLELDRFTRELRFESLARETFRTLPAGQQDWLRAYADGINTAFDETAFLTRDEFALLQITPDRWRPWHTLAIERLMAWLAVQLDTTSAPATQPASFARFLASDRALRSWLQLHSFDYGFAWVYSDSTDTLLGERYVTGSTPTPLLLETLIQTPAGSRIVAGIPGSPITPTGRSGAGSWAGLLHSTARLRMAPTALSDSVPTIHERIEGRGGLEFLHTFRPGDGHIQFFSLPDTSGSIPDSALTLFWSGLGPGTDFDAWRQLATADSAAFSLFDGATVRMRPDGSWDVAGVPPYRETVGSVTLIGGTPWTPYLARHLDALSRVADDAGRLATWNDDCYSEWAADLTPRFLAALGRSDSLTAIDRDALTYLRNWDFSYARASIGAAIFEAWLTQLQRGALAGPGDFDTLPEDAVLLTAFRSAVDVLADSLSNDLSTWRLENYRPSIFLYPAWSHGGVLQSNKHMQADTRFAPLQLPGRGHPSTLCWGSFETNDGFQASATWDAWTHAAANDTLYTLRRSLDASGFLGRYRIPVQPPDAHRLHTGMPPESVTRLVPAER